MENSKNTTKAKRGVSAMLLAYENVQKRGSVYDLQINVGLRGREKAGWLAGWLGKLHPSYLCGF